MSEIITSNILLHIIKTFEIYKIVKKNEPNNPFVMEFEGYMFQLKEAIKDI